MPGFSIGKLAKAVGVSIDTIRFYEKSGLLPAAERRPSGFRYYREADIRQLVFIRHARGVGFSLEEIADLLRLVPTQDVTVATQIIEDKLVRIGERIAELQQWERMLNELRCGPEGSTLPNSIVEFFDSEVRVAMADLSQLQRPLPRDAHE